MTRDEVEHTDSMTAVFRSSDFIKRFAAIRLHMRDYETADRLAEADAMARELDIHPATVRLMFAFVDAFDASEELIEVADLIAATPVGAAH